MLNVQQILEEGLLKLDNTQGKPAQVGYDLSLKSINRIHSASHGSVFKDKTDLVEYVPFPPSYWSDGKEGWYLQPDTYEIVFNEGCKIPNNRVAFIKQRSSLWRNGTLINSPVFDPGFETENMGTMMLVTHFIFIEKDARVAQIYFHECDPAEEYNGQWQFDRQRNQ